MLDSRQGLQGPWLGGVLAAVTSVFSCLLALETMDGPQGSIACQDFVESTTPRQEAKALDRHTRAPVYMAVDVYLNTHRCHGILSAKTKQLHGAKPFPRCGQAQKEGMP